MTIQNLPYKPPKMKEFSRKDFKKFLDATKKLRNKPKDKPRDGGNPGGKSQKLTPKNKKPNKLIDKMRNMPPKKSGAGYSGSY